MFVVTRVLSFRSRLTLLKSSQSSIILKSYSTAATMTTDKGDLVKKRYENIKKSPNDKRLYRGLILKNDMKVLLISDSTTDKSAASLDVKVGHCSDPKDLPGLAHFLEHMLFLGTAKYPDPSEYHSYLSQHGGGSNASTTLDVTNYYFEVTPESLEGALDRFAQFFLSPLFTESSTELEVSAVHSEHLKNLANDSWRIEQLDRSSASPSHPYSKFGTGNRDTLVTRPQEKGINVREALLKFHDDYYSSNIMSLSVLGKETLDELEQMVINKFSDVQNKGIEAPEWPEHPFNEQHFQHKTYIIPIKDIRSIRMSFPLPDLRDQYRAFAESYVSHLIGHEGEGSLLTALKKAGWCTCLEAGKFSPSRSGCIFFLIAVDLTEEGIKHIDEIITLTFQYINMIKKIGPLKWLFDEFKQIAQMEFDFKEKLPPRHSVNKTARALQKYPMEEVLSGPYLPIDWRPDLVNQVMDHLIPENIRVYVVGKLFENMITETETWYGTQFHIEKIPDVLIKKWRDPEHNDELKIPAKNEFIPENFDIKIKQLKDDVKIEKYPVIIEDNPLMRIWFKQDDEFLVPKVDLTFDFNTPVAASDPINCNLTYMYIELFKDSMNQYAYNATLAGLSWGLSCNKYGLTLSISGYHDKLHILLKKIVDKMINFTVDPKLFDIFLEYYIRTLKNFAFEQPYQHAVYYLAVLLTEQVWTKDELLEATQYITVDRLKQFVPQIFSKLHIECLIHGNVTELEALDLAKIVENELTKESTDNKSKIIIPLLPQQLILHREINLESGCYYLYKVENKLHKSSCTEVYYQSGLQSTESNMHLELLTQIMSQKSFNVLRTKEQLGYIVYTGIRRNSGVQGFRIVVQSDRHPDFVEQRIEVFIESMMSEIQTMSDEEFNRHKASLATQRLEKPKMMTSLSSIFWHEILNKQYNFDRANIEVAYLMTITKDQIVQFFKDIAYNEASRRKLTVHVISKAEGGAGFDENSEKMDEKTNYNNARAPTNITDVVEFKSSQSLFPLLKPFNNIPRKNQQSKL